ncbi:hypothetical protein OF829_10315 [Sphingomonas sp. LB-2]|uniref:hypothetical protein n=1 Tax=Sphingomonas caeni TaxID=2984949 RepID=UPI00223027E3|nr:hypothetical protein [Sphingomonas caeni]MCW3847637.1 hypothetical protein [Sphingomonas caeni]
MLVLLALPALIIVAAPAADRLFVSPMGEPFVGDKANPPALTWFNGADADKDGKVSIYEFEDDAQRFFKTLDLDHSGEIDPQENERYELLIQQAISDSGGGVGRGMDRGYDPEADGMIKPNVTYVRRGGASSYNWLGIPQPVMSADTNFNRGVTAQEFDRAAITRFRLLDTNGDGNLDKAELPKS